MRTRAVTNVLLAIVMCAAAATPAAAQTGSKPGAPASGKPAMDVSGGYSYLREQGTGGSSVNVYNKGWVASFGCGLGTGWMTAVGEVGQNFNSDDFQGTQKNSAVLGGVRFRLLRLGRLSTFAQALVGLEVYWSPGFSEHGMAFQPGAGVDLPIRGKVGLRLQGDYRIAHEEGINFNEGRFAASVVIGIR